MKVDLDSERSDLNLGKNDSESSLQKNLKGKFK